MSLILPWNWKWPPPTTTQELSTFPVWICGLLFISVLSCVTCVQWWPACCSRCQAKPVAALRLPDASVWISARSSWERTAGDVWTRHVRQAWTWWAVEWHCVWLLLYFKYKKAMEKVRGRLVVVIVMADCWPTVPTVTLMLQNCFCLSSLSVWCYVLWINGVS